MFNTITGITGPAMCQNMFNTECVECQMFEKLLKNITIKKIILLLIQN